MDKARHGSFRPTEQCADYVERMTRSYAAPHLWKVQVGASHQTSFVIPSRMVFVRACVRKRLLLLASTDIFHMAVSANVAEELPTLPQLLIGRMCSLVKHSRKYLFRVAMGVDQSQSITLID